MQKRPRRLHLLSFSQKFQQKEKVRLWQKQNTVWCYHFIGFYGDQWRNICVLFYRQNKQITDQKIKLVRIIFSKLIMVFFVSFLFIYFWPVENLLVNIFWINAWNLRLFIDPKLWGLSLIETWSNITRNINQPVKMHRHWKTCLNNAPLNWMHKIVGTGKKSDDR